MSTNDFVDQCQRVNPISYEKFQIFNSKIDVANIQTYCFFFIEFAILTLFSDFIGIWCVMQNTRFDSCVATKSTFK